MGRSREKIYILPNLITTASLTCGLVAVIRAVHGDFQVSVLLILVCALLDMLDGQVARMTNSTSRFGAEYDSLSDAVVFGVAPALIAYLWFFQIDLGGEIAPLWHKAFLPACLFYSIATVLRLVRFNIQSGLMEKHVFRGLPSPAAAVFLASCLWLLLDTKAHPGDYVPFITISAVALGILMVSSVSFYSLKGLSLKGRMPFITLLSMVAFFSISAFDVPFFIFFISLVYVVSGPLLLGVRFIKRRHHCSMQGGSKRDRREDSGTSP